MQYQSFPSTKGASKSLEKLAALRLPSLKNKRFLDLGCNEGYFCGYAIFDGAEEVIGIDQSKEAIKRASARFHTAKFYRQSWDKLPEGKFDVITLLSALHYADDQEALIHNLMTRISDNGLLVLEISIAPGGADKWVEVERAIDKRLFPTRQKISSILDNYAWKITGHSANQSGDPLQRYVVHVRKKRPYVFLLMGLPGTGKSTITRTLFTNSNTNVVSGDAVYCKIANGRIQAPDTLTKLVSDDFSVTTIGETTRKVLAENQQEALVDTWIKQGSQSGFVLDSYVPQKHQESIRELFSEKGFFPVDISWNIDQNISTPKKQIKRANDYQNYLKTIEQPGSHTYLTVQRQHSNLAKKQIRWHLDQPVNKQLIDKNNNKIRLAGWLLTTKDHDGLGELFVKDSNGTTTIQMTQKRDDALRNVFGDSDNIPQTWLKRKCGFNITIQNLNFEQPVEIGVMYKNKELILCRIKAGKLANADKKASLIDRLVNKIASINQWTL